MHMQLHPCIVPVCLQDTILWLSTFNHHFAYLYPCLHDVGSAFVTVYEGVQELYELMCVQTGVNGYVCKSACFPST